MDMNTSPSQNDSPNSAYRDLLIEMATWQQDRKDANVIFFAEAIAKNQVSILPGKEFTVRRSNCDCCLKSQKAGIRNFFYSNGTSFKFHVCDGCFEEIVTAAGAHLLTQEQASYLTRYAQANFVFA
jgi:hypothetical protein